MRLATAPLLRALQAVVQRCCEKRIWCALWSGTRMPRQVGSECCVTAVMCPLIIGVSEVEQLCFFKGRRNEGANTTQRLSEADYTP